MDNTDNKTANPTSRLEDEIDLRAAFGVINRHKWGIASFVFVISLLALLILFSMEPIYQGKATLLLESQEANVVSIEEVYGLPGGGREYYQTQYEILSSRSVGERVIRELKLHSHPDFSLEPKPFLGVDWRGLLPGAGEEEAPSKEAIAFSTTSSPNFQRQ